MLEINGFVTGAYPRSEELIKAFRKCFKKEISREELKKKILDEVKEIVEVQSTAGLKYIVDGMFEWHDLLRPVAENLSGVEINGLARWFDNNTFYKKPIITRNISSKDSILKDYIYPEIIPPGKWKLILPDPYTFISLSENRSGLKLDQLLFRYAELLNEELVELEIEYGIGQVQLSAPSLVWSKLDEDTLYLVGDAVEEMLKNVKAEKMIHFFFGDGLNVLPHVLEYKVDVLGFDLTRTNLMKLAEYDIESIALGIIDGRNSLIEDVEVVLKKVEKYLNKKEPRLLYITPSCDLEFLTPEIAREKTILIKRIVNALREIF
ncbi:MAG: hypothetical protein QXT92_07770 [Nitrososphaerota archaeon]